MRRRRAASAERRSHVGQLAAKHPRRDCGSGGLGAASPARRAEPAGAEEGHRLKGALKGGLTTVGGAASVRRVCRTLVSRHGVLRSWQDVSDAARQHILMKLAGEDVMKANISGGHDFASGWQGPAQDDEGRRDLADPGRWSVGWW
jgi:hypothetical protein